MRQRQNLSQNLKAAQRTALLGRLRMADWIAMPEREFAREIEKIETDPLFKKLFFGREGAPGLISRQRWPNGRFSGSFYEVDERTAAKGESVQVEEAVAERLDLLPLIKKMGQDSFERYFLRGEEALSLEEIARRVGLAAGEVERIHELLLHIGAQEEFYLPEREPAMARRFSCLARVDIDGGEPSFEFFSPHWARGLYHIKYESLDEWKKDNDLEPGERKRLPALLKRVETVNLRQNTLYRILETLTKLQADFIGTRDPSRKRPISLRQLAHRLDVAPSTVSRAASGRSVRMPWERELPLIDLMPGRRKVVLDILGHWLEQGAQSSDAALAERLKAEYAIKISRRTVNAARHQAAKRLSS